MVDMAVHQILPAAIRYTDDLCRTLSQKQTLRVPCHAETELVRQLSEHTDALYTCIQSLKASLKDVPQKASAASVYYHDMVIPCMEKLRSNADFLEAHTAKSYWPYPTYSDLLYY